MDDLDGIPRGGHEPNPIKAIWKYLHGLKAEVSVLQRAAPQRSMSLTDGGDLTIKNGGRVTIEDQGEVVVVGQGEELISQDPVEVRASLANRLHFNSWIEQTILQAGLFLGLNESRGDRDPRVVSDDGLQIEMASAVEPLLYGPQVGPTMVTDAGVTVGPGRASIGTGTWDDALNPGGGGGLAGHKGYATISLRPHDIMLWLGSQTGGTPEIPDGLAVGITGTLEAGKLELYGRNGVNVAGPFTVDGSPVASTALATASTDGLMPKADKAKLDAAAVVATPNTLVLRNGGGQIQVASPGSAPDAANRGYVDTQIATRAPTSHTHTTAQVTGLDTALAGKASTAVATSTTDGLMPSTDKSKLDGSTPAPTAFRMVQRDSLGRAQVADPAVAADVANMGYVDAQITAVKPGSWVPIPASTGWQPQASDITKAKIINGVVYMGGKYQYIGAATTVGGFYATSKLIGQMPAGYYPPSEVQAIAIALWAGTGHATTCRIAIGTTGEIRMYAQAFNGTYADFQIGAATYVYMSSFPPYPLP